MSSLSDKIKRLRKSRGLSQRALARKAGISHDYISKIEMGRAENIGTKTLEKIADALMVNTLELQLKKPLSKDALLGNLSEDSQNLVKKLPKGFHPDKDTLELLKMWSRMESADRQVVLSVASQLAPKASQH